MADPTIAANPEEIVSFLFSGASKSSVSGEFAAYCDDRSGAVPGIGPNCNSQKEEGAVEIAECYYKESMKCVDQFAKATQVCCQKMVQLLMANKDPTPAITCQDAAKEAMDACKGQSLEDKCECKRCVFTIRKPLPETPPTDTPPDTTDDGDTTQDQDESADPKKRSVRTNSNYGVIQRVYGRYVVGGNIIWVGNQVASPVVYARKNSKGVVTTITDTVTTVDFLAGISVGPLDSIIRIWFNDVLIYNATVETDGAGNAQITPTNPGATDLDLSILADGDYAMERLAAFRPGVRMYKGSAAEHVIPALAKKEGFGRVPANRGLATIYFSNIDVALFGGTFPEIRFDVVSIPPSEVAPRILSGTVTTTGAHLEVDHRLGTILTRENDDLHLLSYDTLAATYDPTSLSSALDDVMLMKSGSVYTVDSFVEDVFNPYFSRLEHRNVSTPEITRASRATIYADASGHQYDLLALVAGDNAVELRTYDHAHATMTTSAVAAIAATNGGDSVITTVDGELRLYQFVTPTVAQTELTIRYIKLLEPTTTVTIHVPNTSLWGSGTVASVIQATLDTTDNSFVLFFDVAGDGWVAKISATGAVSWTAAAPFALPTVYSLGEHRSLVPSSVYYFVNDAGEVIGLNTSDGTFSLNTTLAAESLPDLGGAQYYDSRTQSILYRTDDNRFARFFLNRITPVDISLKQVFDTLAEQISLPYGYLDTSDLADVYLKGFSISSKTSLRDIINTLGEFYQFSSLDAGSRFILTKETTLSSTVAVDAMDDFLPPSFTITRMITESLIDGATVRFSGIDDKGLVELYQTVSVKADIDTQKLPSVVDFSLDVYDDAESMRINLEKLVARKRADATVIDGEAMPRLMGLTVRDRIIADGKTFMIRQQLLGAGMSSRLTGSALDQSVINSSAALEAVSLATGVEVVRAQPSQPYRPVVLFTNALSDADSVRATSGQQVVYSLVEAPTEILDGPTSVSFRSLAVGDQVVPTTGPIPTAQSSVFPVTDTNSPNYVSQPHSKGAHSGRVDVAPGFGYSDPFTSRADDSLVVVFDRPDTSLALGSSVAPPYYSVLETPTQNLLIVGREYIQYGSADIDPDGVTVTFTNLFRGLFGTEPYMEHAVGDRVYFYTSDTIKPTGVDAKYFKRGQDVRVFFPSAEIAGVPSVFYHTKGDGGTARPWAPQLHDWAASGLTKIRSKVFRRRPLVVDLMKNLGTLPNDWNSVEYAYKLYLSEPTIAEIETDLCRPQARNLVTTTVASESFGSFLMDRVTPGAPGYWMVVCHLAKDSEGEYIVGHPAKVYIPAGYTTTFNDT